MGIEAIRVEGIDPFAVFEGVQMAVERCRHGTGPIFIEAMTKRWAGTGVIALFRVMNRYVGNLPPMPAYSRITRLPWCATPKASAN
jgi:hypothetical protein